jgi:hypothetical protein
MTSKIYRNDFVNGLRVGSDTAGCDPLRAIDLMSG